MRTRAALLLTLVAAACGGGGESLSHQELLERADAVCADFQERMEDIQGNFGEPEYDRGVLHAMDDELEALRGLDAPEEDSAPYERMLDHLADARGRYEESMAIPRTEANGDRVLQAFGLLMASVDAAAREARNLGIQSCVDVAE